MVVLLIIGITLHFASQSWGDFGEARAVITAAEQFKTQVTGLQQQAVLAGLPLGLSVSASGYQVVSFQPPKDWIVNKGFQTPGLPARVILHTTIKKSLPAVLIDAQGNVKAFKIDFGTISRPHIACVVGSDNSEISVRVDCK